MRVKKREFNIDEFLNNCIESNGEMTAEEALQELSRWLLGENFYIKDSLTEGQRNYAIVAEIECRYNSVNMVQ